MRAFTIFLGSPLDIDGQFRPERWEVHLMDGQVFRGNSRDAAIAQAKSVLPPGESLELFEPPQYVTGEEMPH